jgi:hypothetical protein
VKRIAIVVIVLILLAAVGASAWLYWPRRTTVWTDAETIRRTEDAARVRQILWQPPVALSPQINSIADEYEPRTTPDGRTLFFVRGRPGAGADIYCCEKQPGGWSTPRPLDAINSDGDDLGPHPSPDGRQLLFYSDRVGGLGGYDLWKSRRGPGGWQTPVNLGAVVNSELNDYGPALSPDGRTLYFASNRPNTGDGMAPSPDAWQATVREDLFRHDYDLYESKLTDAGYTAPTRIDALCTPKNEGAPALSPAGDFIYFSSDRDGGLGGFDLYRARWLGDRFESPEGLGAEVNTAANELDPSLDTAGYALYFSSDRAAASPTPVGRRQYDLYRSQSREVFRQTDTQYATIDWPGLWARIGPSLLWALLALTLILLLLALLRDMKQRRLSLLARCLLASLLLHLLLMLLLNVVEVTASIASAFRQSNRISISLASAARADDLSMQLRGQLTDAEVPRPTMPDAPRPEMQIDIQLDATAAVLTVDASRPAPVEAPAFDAKPIESSVERIEAPSDLPDPPAPSETMDMPLDTPDAAAPIDATESETIDLPRPTDDAPDRIARAPVTTTQPAMTLAPTDVAANDDADEFADRGRFAAAAPSEAEPPPQWAASTTSDSSMGGAVPRFELSLPGGEAPAADADDSNESQDAPPFASSIAVEPSPSRWEPLAVAAMDDAPTYSLDPMAAEEAKPSDDVVFAVGNAPDEAISNAPALVAAKVDAPSPGDFGLPPIDLALPTEVAAPPTEPADALGTIRGTITDAATGAPLAGARIQLDLPGDAAVTAESDRSGRYTLHAPRVPDHFALSASRDGYLPGSVNVPADRLQRGLLEIDFDLEPVTEQVIALEAEPQVHHLGNDRFEGRINSQFQRASEGLRFRGEFALTAGQLATEYQSARVEMLVKGVQCPHEIRINGRRIERRIAGSPGDGSFGRFTASFDASWLREGDNTIRIKNVHCRSDVDDFEFVNIQLRLIP